MGIPVANKDESKAAGGFARAEALSADERKLIGRKAADARWHKHLPMASHEGVIRIGEIEIACAVINTDSGVQRLITQSGFMRALGRARQAKGRRYYKGDVNLPAFLTAQNLKPFVSKELEVTSSQIEFRHKNGLRAFGYADSLLPEVCDVFLKADRAGILLPNQRHIADHAHIIYKGLAHLGIAGLIDEATGYQEVRDKHALQAILDAFLRKELATWAKRFPDEFYEQIARLKNWKWRGRGVNPPQVVAAYTKDIVYARLAPNIVAELEKKNPIENGRRPNKHHQWLTDDVGHPALAQHLHAVITLMRVASNWGQFKHWLDVAHPRKGETLQLPLMSDPTPAPASDGQRQLFESASDP